MREHLKACASCRAAASGWLQARKALGSASVAARAAIDDSAPWEQWQQQILRAVGEQSGSIAAHEQAQPITVEMDRATMRRRAQAIVCAAASLLVGVWIGARTDGGLLSRDPIVAEGGSTQARSLLQPLGQERAMQRRSIPARTAAGLEWRRMFPSPGLDGRLLLRTLEDQFDAYPQREQPMPPSTNAPR